MGFWSRKKKAGQAVEERVEAKPAKKTRRLNCNVPFEAKLLAVEARLTGIRSRDLADLVGVSSNTIDKWKNDYVKLGPEGLMRKPSSIKTRHMCKAIEQRIEDYRMQHPDRGVRRIRDELKRNNGIDVNAEQVRQVVNEAGMGNAPVQAKRRPPQVRRFEKSTPNVMWQIDIFTFELKRMYRVYLIGIIDDNSRYIVGHGLYRRQSAEAVLEVVKGAMGQWGAPREILSDNGRQFAAWRGKTRFQKLLNQQGVQHVRSAPHHPMTLGKIERFWQTIWKEFLYEASFASFADACQRIDHWISYYNHQRPHQGIGSACPADRFYGMEKDVQEAIKQGCRENALRIAMGQEPRNPLYLMGRLGDTDVSVIRKGEDIEVKLGDDIREVIQLGAPYTIDTDGTCRREGLSHGQEMEQDERSGKISCSGDSEEGRSAAQGDMRHVWSNETDTAQGHGAGGGSGPVCAGAEAEGEEGQKRGGEAPCRGGETEGCIEEGNRGVETEVRGGQGVSGPSAEAGRDAEEAGTEEKKTKTAEGQATVACESHSWPWDWTGHGPWE